MSRFALFAAASAFALSGCGTGEGNESANAANAAAGSRTENGQLTARVQGVDLKVNLPLPIQRMTDDNPYLYPGARPVRDPAPVGQHFTSTDSPEAVARWYRDPARASRFTFNGGSEHPRLIELTGRGRNGDYLSVAISPGPDGGTEISIVAQRR